jgi:crossover junction endodeoxyribonuclease RuvC
VVILGIDPGLANCGWGIIELKNKKPRLLGCGVFTSTPKSLQSQRLTQIKNNLEALLLKYRPDEAAIEELFFYKNKKTAFAVTLAHGVIALGLAEANIPSFNYTPLQAKLALTGFGKASKKQIQLMVQNFLELKTLPHPTHAADALAVALAHCFQRKQNLENRI